MHPLRPRPLRPRPRRRGEVTAAAGRRCEDSVCRSACGGDAGTRLIRRTMHGRMHKLAPLSRLMWGEAFSTPVESSICCCDCRSRAAPVGRAAHRSADRAPVPNPVHRSALLRTRHGERHADSERADPVHGRRANAPRLSNPTGPWLVTSNVALEPGDLINTGTPPAVKQFLLPALFLHGEEALTLGISKLSVSASGCSHSGDSSGKEPDGCERILAALMELARHLGAARGSSGRLGAARGQR